MEHQDIRNLSQRLVEVRKGLGGMPLKKNAKGYGYTYADEEAVVGALLEGLNREGVDFRVSVLPDVYPLSIVPRLYKNAKGDEKQSWVATGMMKATFINSENPADFYEDFWAFVGEQDDPAQAVGSAATYGVRYYLLKRFLIPTTDKDPEYLAAQRKLKDAKKEQSKPAAEQVAPENMTTEQAKMKKISVKWTREDGSSASVKGAIGDFTDDNLMELIRLPQLPAVHRRAVELVLKDRGIELG